MAFKKIMSLCVNPGVMCMLLTISGFSFLCVCFPATSVSSFTMLSTLYVAWILLGPVFLFHTGHNLSVVDWSLSIYFLFIIFICFYVIENLSERALHMNFCPKPLPKVTLAFCTFLSLLKGFLNNTSCNDLSFQMRKRDVTAFRIKIKPPPFPHQASEDSIFQRSMQLHFNLCSSYFIGYQYFYFHSHLQSCSHPQYFYGLPPWNTTRTGVHGFGPKKHW